MAIIMNESLGSLEYDSLINSAYPADIIHASLASGYGKLKRGYLIAKNSSGNLIPWGSDITDDLVSEVAVSGHEASKSQAGLDTNFLKVFALDFYSAVGDVDSKEAEFEKAGLKEDTLEVYAREVFSDPSVTVTAHVATLSNKPGLDLETLVVIVGTDVLEEGEHYTAEYSGDDVEITMLEGDHYAASTLDITCLYEDYDKLTETTHYTAVYSSGTLKITLVDSTDYTDTPDVRVYCEYTEDEYKPLTKTTDYTFTYLTNTLTVTLVAGKPYYDTPKVKVVCPYAYNEGTIASGNLVLAEDVDTGDSSGTTVVAKAYRTGIFNQKRLLHNAKALGGITDITKEKLRSVGILLNDSISL